MDELFVSNPIKEYLQIEGFFDRGFGATGFKPYKGVSSNQSVSLMFSSLKTVSNPIREYLQIVFISILCFISSLGFKPYKGVSSNQLS